jgi:hypothetical protein
LLRQKKSAREKQSDSSSFLLRLFAGILVFVIIIPLSLILILHIPAVQKQLFQKVLEKIETSTGISVQLESFKWAPLHELHLFNVKVTSSGENVLTCEEAKLGYHLSWNWPYLRPEELSLGKPWLQLERDAQGQWRLPATKFRRAENAPGSKPFPWSSFPWPQVRIVSGEIVAYQDGQTVLSVRDVNASLSFEEVVGSDGPRLKINFGQWQGCAEIPELGEWELTGEAEITGQTFSVAQLKLNVPKMAQLSTRGRWDLVSPFDGTLEIQILQLSTADLPLLHQKFPQLKEITGSLVLGRESGIWILDHDLKSNVGNLQGTLRLDSYSINDRTIQLVSRFSDLQVPVPSQTFESHLFGQLEVTVEGSRLQNAQVRLHTVLEASRWGDQTIQKGEVIGTYQKGMLEVKVPKIQSTIGDFDFSLNADINGLWDHDHEGQVKLDLRAERATLEKIYSGAAQRFGGSIVYEGRYGAGDFARWERWQGKMEANLSLPQLLTLKASGNQKNDSLTLDYDLEVTELQKFSAIFPSWRAQGKVTSRGNIKGRWPDLVWEGLISSPLLQFGAIQAEQASLKGKGRIIGKEGQRDLTLKAQNLSAAGKKLGSLNLDIQQEADACRFNIRSEGLLNEGSARLSGRLEKIWGPVRTLLVSQSALAWKNQSASLDGRIEVGQDGIHVQSLSIQHGKEKAQLAGDVFFDAKTDLKLTLDGIDVGQWLQLVLSEKYVSGVASGQVHLKGRTDQPEASITMQLVNGAVMVPKKAATSSESSRQIKSASQEALIDRLQLQGTLARDILNIQGDLQSPSVQNPVRFSAKIPMHLTLKPPRLEVKAAEECAFTAKVAGFQAVGVLPYLAFLEKLGGRIDLDAQGGGPIGHPLVTASGSWQNGLLKLKKWPHPIENIQIDWRADSKEIILSKGTVEFLGGHADLKGRVSYPWFQEMDFEATGSDLDVKDIYGVKGKASGHAQLTKTTTATKLTGELNLSKAEMNLGRLETDLARNIRVIDGDGKEDVLEVRKDATEQNSFVEKLEMDLTINLPLSGTWVRGMGLEAEIAGALKIEKRPFAPVKLHGGFQTLRGEYKFQEYKMKIVEGELIFPEAPQPEPHLRIVCQKDVKDVIIQAHVTGPLKQPKLVLSSIPSMNQVDILSYLLFDRAAGDLSSKESVQLQDRAASWLGSQTSQLLKKVIGNTLLTPDTIEYRKTTTKTTGSTGSKTEVGVVAIGKYITPDLYVNFEKGVTGEEGNQVNVEYRLNRHFSIQTEFGGTQQSGIDLFWRYDFGK